ncbi:PP2C family protein-serine/threonine phosphatase [Roseibium album]|uniref:PPM-type phosphatase domain-containing protein n=1 Tax=Roseibium album TaxID=311410 RepID=A0A0M6ZIH3_9HYPH|nr:protein phosphatase 2C domain-containing protein [Roseibium album]CTQ61916.1 hypothetical protein LA5094_04698 [Roseibium album]CTQ78172.1 hypothetical protein LA5096_05482 [Roseibium album]CTQ79681.1 hypothetical protein LA5095_04907 [Roseibium album]
MNIGISWRSEQGLLTPDNRDWCGIGLRNDAILCIVLDGSTSGENSGEYAHQIARRLVDWFTIFDNVTLEAIIDRLRFIHRELTLKFRRSSASFVIAFVEKNGLTHLLHAGDCLAMASDGALGLVSHIQPHTLTNAICQMPIDDIASSPLRNRLTRSFRSTEFMPPDVCNYTPVANQKLILATDGFWAALDSEEKAKFLAGDLVSSCKERDDCSVLSLEFSSDRSGEVKLGTSKNCYLMDARA